MTSIDLSCDLGEAMNERELEIESRIWPLITSANIACGGHVGDVDSMRRSARLAKQYGVTVGAHPSYPDREHFGRRSMKLESAALVAALSQQLDALAAVCDDEGVRLERVKPHGALYNDAHHDEELASLLVDLCNARRLLIVAAHGSAVNHHAARTGVRVIREGFGDRRYRVDGSLEPRSEAGSLLIDFAAAAEQARRLALGRAVVTAEGALIRIPCETLCVHSDTPNAPERLAAIREALATAGVTIQSPEH